MSRLHRSDVEHRLVLSRQRFEAVLCKNLPTALADAFPELAHGNPGLARWLGNLPQRFWLQCLHNLQQTDIRGRFDELPPTGLASPTGDQAGSFEFMQDLS